MGQASYKNNVYFRICNILCFRLTMSAVPVSFLFVCLFVVVVIVVVVVVVVCVGGRQYQ